MQFRPIKAVLLTRAGSSDIEFGILYQDGMLLVAGDQPEEGVLVPSSDLVRRGDIQLISCLAGHSLLACGQMFYRRRGIPFIPSDPTEGPAAVTVTRGNFRAAGIVMRDRVKFRDEAGRLANVLIENFLNGGGAILSRNIPGFGW
jgi:hypothetical protein